MNNEIWAGFELCNKIIWPLCLSVAGCLARHAHHGWKGVRQFVRELILCCFFGIIIFWALDFVDYSEEVKAAIISGGSFASITLVDVILDKLTHIIRNIHIPGLERFYRVENNKIAETEKE